MAAVTTNNKNKKKFKIQVEETCFHLVFFT